MQASSPVRTVLFDLDGTLLDTAPDLAYALNHVLHEQGCGPLPFEQIRPKVSHGARALVRLGFGLGPEDADYGSLRQRLLDVYRANLACRTRLFPGMDTVLTAIEQRGLSWGVVTNKPAWLTDPLMDSLGLAARASCVVSGDTTGNSKPHPEPMLHACQRTGSRPAEAIYVGDAPRDIQAGRSAGVRTLVALFGYLEPDDRPESWGADGSIERPEELLDWLPSARPASP
ncbi:MAG: HAD-IA family hydrolase [Gammaproteobacteria bacterium]|nr:HAD-IA family hydrolase [Gammaproteobacteria bacterium]